MKQTIKLILTTIAIILILTSGIKIGQWIDQATYNFPGVDKAATAQEVNIIFLLLSSAFAILFFCLRVDKNCKHWKRVLHPIKKYWYYTN